MRSFYILNHRTSAPSSPKSNGVIPRQTGKRVRLRYRDMIWAYHSESQEILLDASIAACNGKMCWSDARALGVFIWLSSAESLVRTRLFHRLKLSFFLGSEITSGAHCSE
jgi:hypothetical protein